MTQVCHLEMLTELGAFFLEKKQEEAKYKKKTTKFRLTLPDSWSIRAHVFPRMAASTSLSTNSAVHLVDEMI